MSAGIEPTPASLARMAMRREIGRTHLAYFRLARFCDPGQAG